MRDFRLQFQPLAYTLAIMLVATAVSFVLHESFIQNNNVSIIYTLAVVAVACVTPGYFYGICASLISVLGVNYFFAAPYWAFNFSETGYPITFLTLLIASIITSTLVTGYRERERALTEADNEKLRSNLLRAISHDLRTPLTSISGSCAAMLADDEMAPSVRRALLSDIRENSEWLVRMVENLLSVTRMQGSATIQKTPEMAEEVIANAVSQVRRRFPAQVIELSAPAEPLMVSMDSTLIEQVIINLIENSIYHSGVSSPIAVSVEKGEGAIFVVRDHGIGVDVPYVVRLMDGHADPQRVGDSQRGIGIGLALCAAIVRAHGGEFSVCNVSDGGARFSFTLPFDMEDQQFDEDMM